MSLFTLEKVNFENIINYSDIQILEGGVTFICGDSGTGKSTLLKLLNGVLDPTEGEVIYEGKGLSLYDSMALRRDILLVSQSAYLFNGTIRDNFATFYEYRELACISDEEMKRYLKICSIDLPLETMSYNLSGGEKQRVFIAICLSFEPKVLMLDEPTSALDERNAFCLMENIKSYCAQQGKTLLVISHDLKIVDYFADYRIQLGRDR